MTTNYRVAPIIKLNGFGVSVIQRLCKTSVKKNLYWSIKDKVIEETFNGIRSVKKTAKVRIYGLDSNREVRARLIEILYDRVQYHKDKFICPLLHHEMECMEVKKNGKVEHSDTTHDDQVFSYLMAMYVWYDGENLAERYGIQKNTIKTDEDEEIEEAEYQDQLEARAKLDMSQIDYEENNPELAEALTMIENDKFIDANMFADQNRILEMQQRETMLASNRQLRDAYCKETGVDPSMYGAVDMNVNLNTELPDTLFLDLDDDLLDPNTPLKVDSHVQGNMAEWWNIL